MKLILSVEDLKMFKNGPPISSCAKIVKSQKQLTIVRRIKRSFVGNALINCIEVQRRNLMIGPLLLLLTQLRIAHTILN